MGNLDKMRTSVVLFTRDLRVHDQPALAAAARESERIVPLFVEDAALRAEFGAPNRLAFLAESLACLDGELRARGGALVVRRGDVVEEVRRVVAETGAAAVHLSRDVSAYAQRREARLDEAVALRLHDGVAAVPPDALAPSGGDYYKVFTPYWRAWLCEPLRDPEPPPARILLPDGVDPGTISRAEGDSPQRPPGGETAGRARMDAWLRGGIERYGERQRLDLDATSRLSPYLHFGCISPLELVQAALTDAEGLTSRAGTALVAAVADRVSLTAGLSDALAGVRERRSRHDPGRVLRDLALTLADGGDCLADLRSLRDQEALFGAVASDATAWRTLAALDEPRLHAIRVARAEARRRVWEQAGAPERIVLDLDGTLVTAHSDKQGAAGTYKGGFGFHPLLCYEAETGEALAGILRPGNAGFNTACDHIELLERALAQLPAEAVGPGLLVRCDRGGATHAFLDHVAGRGLRFTVGLDLTEPVREAILALAESAWQPATASDGDQREGAWVAELALELSSWPAGTRAICRRERPHPGAQLSFTDANGYRFQVFLTNQQGSRLARLEQLQRARAACEDRIRCGKESGVEGTVPVRNEAPGRGAFTGTVPVRNEAPGRGVFTGTVPVKGPADAFVREVAWRDFYAQLLLHRPETSHDDFHPRGDAWDGDEELLDAWRAGETGYPVVDAGMRQLRAEGWMHNRARLITASFLTKHLYLDWRHGAAHFFELLVDGDVANNVGNWQWVAGTGVDTRPNRVYNPTLQAQRHDPSGDYVRRWVPELARVEGAAVHEPWKLPARERRGYPEPVVDHAWAVRRFRERRSGQLSLTDT